VKVDTSNLEPVVGEPDPPPKTDIFGYRRKPEMILYSRYRDADGRFCRRGDDAVSVIHGYAKFRVRT
jgi:hypothetical protein